MPEAATPRSHRPAPPPPTREGTATAERSVPAGSDDHPAERPAPAGDPLAARVRAAAGGLAPLVAQAEAVRRRRSAAAHGGAPRWTDVFTTQFTEFSNRPR